LREQLVQAQKLESVGHLAGGVAHDFNNTLSVILLNGEFTIDRLPPNDPLIETVQQIVDAADRSAALTRQLLAFSRKQSLQPEVIDLNTVIHGLRKMLPRLIGEDIDLSLKLAPFAGLVLADPGQMEQVIINLAVNARDAMPTGGKLEITTALIEVDRAASEKVPELVPGEFLQISVADTGGGMDPEVMKMVFEPFFTTKSVGKGTGLGLSTVYGIVKQSGGIISVESELEQGTTFHIYLPLTEQKAGLAKTPTITSGRPSGSEHILVVEDEISLRSLFSTLLPSLGYKVTVAASGVEALEMLQNMDLPPDLIITDVVMPQMGGKELVTQVKLLHPAMKVLYMSGYTDELVGQHGVSGVGAAFIQKPFRISAIGEKVRALLGSQA